MLIDFSLVYLGFTAAAAGGTAAVAPVTFFRLLIKQI